MVMPMEVPLFTEFFLVLTLDSAITAKSNGICHPKLKLTEKFIELRHTKLISWFIT